MFPHYSWFLSLRIVKTANREGHLYFQTNNRPWQRGEAEQFLQSQLHNRIISYKTIAHQNAEYTVPAAYYNQNLLAHWYLNSTQNTSVNWIIRLLLWLLCWPKVILLSGGHCSTIFCCFIRINSLTYVPGHSKILRTGIVIAVMFCGFLYWSKVDNQLRGKEL